MLWLGLGLSGLAYLLGWLGTSRYLYGRALEGRVECSKRGSVHGFYLELCNTYHGPNCQRAATDRPVGLAVGMLLLGLIWPLLAPVALVISTTPQTASERAEERRQLEVKRQQLAADTQRLERELDVELQRQERLQRQWKTR